MTDQLFDGNLCLRQLNCSGTTSVLQLMEYGYPSRILFTDLHKMYEAYLPPELELQDARVFCEAMLNSLNFKNTDFKFGNTKLFFRPNKFIEFDRIIKSDPENLRDIVNGIRKWIIHSKWVKLLCCAKTIMKGKNLKVNSLIRCSSNIEANIYFLSSFN